MPTAYKDSVGDCRECSVGRMVIQLHSDHEPKKTPDGRIATKCNKCGETGAVSAADAQEDLD